MGHKSKGPYHYHRKIMSRGTPQGGWSFPGESLFIQENFQKGDGMKRWIVFLIGLLLFGCASTRDVRTLDKEMDKLYSQVNALRKENDFTKNDLSDLRAENQKLKTDTSPP